ncbi:ABC transporter substrate-binding protein [Effusibacillus dendaii]|uniref:Putative ABC transporter substrate-binding lipoprotein YvrC n=1 Tax=Effusibacillus dendaii TaxID=2743772 RepID=A0A7I8D546_9BACL|nr:cobalamin-binding protein [Effusibacillus dendaii]BCJ85238.1 putative ABC transporter substrate-binding lipoprotein YvrC [Effusibacillus dendaii]
MIKSGVLFLSFLLAVGVSSGCGPAGQAVPEQGAPHSQTGQTVYPLTLQDATGNQVTIQSEPQRIVSLLPSQTEILFALGLGDRVVGVDKWSDYPPEAKKKPVVGAMTIDPELVLAQKPDLVLGGATADPQGVAKLRSLGLTVFATEPTNMAETEQAIETIGKLTNRSQAAVSVIHSMQETVRSIQDKRTAAASQKEPVVYLEISPDLYTAGKNTFLDELVTLAGGRNAFGEQSGWLKTDGETVAAKKPDVILTTTMGNPQEIVQDILQRPGWQTIPAVKNKRVIALDPNLVSRPGPRLPEGFVAIAKAIHPDWFAK